MIQRICALFLVLILFSSCGHEADTPVSGVEPSVFEGPGLPEIRAVLEDNLPPDEHVLSTIAKVESDPNSGVNDLVADGYDVYSVTFLWGDLFAIGGVSTAPSTIDWSGDFQLTGSGGIRTVAQIDFEKDEDSVLHDDLPMIESWVSVTSSDFDGLSFLVYVDPNSVLTVVSEVIFSTAPISLQYDVAQLKHLFEFHPVSATGGVAVFARKVNFRPCPEGTIEARWVRETSFADSGYFKGLWLSSHGTPIGDLHGTWKKDSLAVGGGSMQGVVTDQRTGATLIRLRGNWFFDDMRLCPMCGEGHGKFRGEFWHNNATDLRPHGFFKGEFGNYELPPADLVQPMTGKWKVNCPHVTVNDPTTSD